MSYFCGHGALYSSPMTGTQEDQDETDSETRKKAMKDLVQSWMDRLQLISVIVSTEHTRVCGLYLTILRLVQTTFFAATEAQLLGITVSDDSTAMNKILQAANAGLAGALVIHVFAGMSLYRCVLYSYAYHSM